MLRTCVTVVSFCFLVFAFSINTYAQTSGKPAGFIRLDISGQAQRLSSNPFVPFSNTVENIFNGQLTGGTSNDTADRIVKWDSATQAYVTVYKCDGTGDSNKDGKWFFSGTFNISTMVITPGDGFWIQNQHAAPQTVFLSGLVVMDGTRVLRFSHGMNLVSYPFSSKIFLNSTTLKECGAHGAASLENNPDIINNISPEESYWLKSLEGDVNNGKWLMDDGTAAVSALKSGRAYWYNRTGNEFFDWVETRPYQNIFSSSSTIPQITNISPNQNKDGVVLTISTSGAAGEKLEIFYKDISEDEILDTASGWKVAAQNIMTDGSNSVTWTDSNGISSTAIRIYTVSRQDIDGDNDKLSDAMENLVTKTNPLNPDTDGDGMPDGWEVQYGLDPLVNDAALDKDADGLSNLREYQRELDPAGSVIPVPQGITVLMESFNKVVLSWGPVASTIPVDGYKIYRDNNLVGTVNTAIFTDSSLEKSTLYRYTVRAYRSETLSDPSEIVSAKTMDSLGTSFDSTIEAVVNNTDPKLINAGNLLGTVQTALNGLGYTDTTFQILDPALINKFIQDEYTMISQPEPAATEAEKEVYRQEITNMMNDNWKGNSFVKLYLFYKLQEIGDLHWQDGKIAAADMLYEQALNIMNNVEGPTFCVLWQRSRFKMMGITAQSTDADVIAAMDAGRDLLLKYFEYFPNAVDMNASMVYSTICSLYFAKFPKLLNYSNYNTHVYSEALLAAQNGKNILTDKLTTFRFNKVSAWELVNSNISIVTPGGNTQMTGTLTLTNTSPATLYPEDKVTDIRTIQLDGTVAVPFYKGHSYGAKLLIDIPGGNPIEYEITNFTYEKGKKITYDMISAGNPKTVENISDPSAPCEIVFLNDIPAAPYNLKAERLPESFKLSWDWVAPSPSYQLKHFIVYRGNIEIGTSTTQSLDGILIASDTMNYTYTIKACDMNDNITPASKPLEVLPQMTAETAKYYAWKATYFGNQPYYDYQDYDSDGLTNYQEYIAGTNPCVAFTSAIKSSITDVTSGVHVEYYSGDSTKTTVVQYVAGTSYASEILPGISFDATGGSVLGSTYSDYVGAVMSGYLDVPADGLYRFYFSSSDGSKLYIDDILTINNDGVHNLVEKICDIKLKAGSHKIKVEFFEYDGYAALKLDWSSAAFARKTIGTSDLWYTQTITPELKEHIAWIKDSDFDGLTDREEYLAGTSITNPDTDGDGITDSDEINKYGTDPKNAQSKPEMVLPSNWTASVDINVKLAGKTFFFDNIYELQASGSGLASTSDSLRMLYENIEGDCEITARIIYIDPYNSLTKAGIMLREDITTNARYAAMLMTPSSNGSMYSSRLATGASAVSAYCYTDQIPLWVKISRKGKTCISYKSVDGATWTKVAEENIGTAGPLKAGLVLTSCDNTRIASAKFDNVSINKISPAPSISPLCGIFKTSQTVTISNAIPGFEIRYTLDGSEPNESSLIYNEPFVLNSGTTIVKAASFRTGYAKSPTSSALFTDEYLPGLTGRYYSGTFAKFASFDNTTASYAAISRLVNYPASTGYFAESNLADKVGVSLKGFIFVPTAGDYKFYLTANDWGKLSIDGTVIISASGINEQASAPITLTAGLHSVKLDAYDGSGSSTLIAKWEGPDLAKQVISNFYSADTDHDAQHDEWEFFKYGNLTTSDGSGDLDGDGISDKDELSTFFTKPDDPSNKPLFDVSVSDVQQGLIASFYKGYFLQYPKFDMLVHYLAAVVPGIYWDKTSYNMAPGVDNDFFAILIKGFVNAPENGIYTFYLKADDKAALYIDGLKIAESVNNDVAGTVSMKAGLHNIRVEFYETSSTAELTLEWAGPDFTRTRIPAEAYFYSTSAYNEEANHNDTDGDGLSDAEEISLGLNSALVDSDGDGLNDYEEVKIYNTDPMNADSDNDGVNDFVEATVAFTDPQAADFSGEPQIVQTILGREFSSQSGDWTVSGDNAVALGRNGWLEYSMSLPANGVYVLEVSGTQNNGGSNNKSFSIDLKIDGIASGSRTLTAPYGTIGKVEFYLPVLAAGTHAARVEWRNIESNTSFKLTSLRVLSMTGPDANSNGVSDWIDTRLNNLTLVKMPETTKTSPICVEGANSQFLEETTISGFYTLPTETPVPPVPFNGPGKTWFADVPLSPAEPTNLAFSFQNGAKTVTKTVTWIPTNVLAENNSAVTLRVNDSLLLSAMLEGQTEGNSSFTIAGQVTELPAATPFAHKFEYPGTYEVNATYTAASGTSISGKIAVKVLNGSFTPNPVVCVPQTQRLWPAQPLPAEAILKYDRFLNVYETQQTASTRDLSLMLNRNEDAYIIARINDPDTGPVLAHAMSNAVTYSTHKQEGYYKIIATFNDGSKILEGKVTLSEIPSDARVLIRISTAGVTFDDGTTARYLTADDFDENGTCRYQLYKMPDAATSVCHSIVLYQGDVLVRVLF